MPAERPETSTPLAEIAHGPGAFEQFLDKNQKLLVVFAVLLVIAAAGLVVYQGIEHSRQQAAGAAFYNAAELPELGDFIGEHAGTRAASSAAILLAEQQWSAGRQEDAIGTLRDFINSNPNHPALATARASLGSKLMTQGKAAEAASAFQQIIDDTRSRYLDPYALISLGDLARMAGDSAKAETLYSRARTDYFESGFASTAAERLASLNATMPVEVEPPAPPAEPEITPQDDSDAELPAFEFTPQSPPAPAETTETPPEDAESGEPAQESTPPTNGETQPDEEPDAAGQP